MISTLGISVKVFIFNKITRHLSFNQRLNGLNKIWFCDILGNVFSNLKFKMIHNCLKSKEISKAFKLKNQSLSLFLNLVARNSFLRCFLKNYIAVVSPAMFGKREPCLHFQLWIFVYLETVFLRICCHIRYYCWFFSADTCAENVSGFFSFRKRIYDLIRRQHCWFTRIRCCNIVERNLWKF